MIASAAGSNATKCRRRLRSPIRIRWVRHFGDRSRLVQVECLCHAVWKSTLILAPIWLVAAGCCAVARADGEVPCVSAAAGGYQVAVFQSPAPLRVGRCHLSLLVQNAATQAWVAQARANLRFSPRDRPGQIHSVGFSPEAASNRLLQTAPVELPESGWWEFEISIDGPLEPGRIHFASEVAPAAPRWFAFWPWFSWPLVVIVLFGGHQFLVSQAPIKSSTDRTARA